MSKIKLTEEEKVLYDSAQNCNIHNSYVENQTALKSSRLLTKLLLERIAIPENRLKYFTDRAYQFGRVKRSRKEIFESNGTKGESIFEHPHFLKYLTFFIEGANVSQDIYEFAKTIKETNQFQDEAISEIFEYIKQRNYVPKELKAQNKFADEIFKLVVDLGFEPDFCIIIRKKLIK